MAWTIARIRYYTIHDTTLGSQGPRARSRPVVQDDPAVCTVTRRRPQGVLVSRSTTARTPIPHLELDVPKRSPFSVHSSTCPLLFTSLVVLGQDRFSTDAYSLPHSHPLPTPHFPGRGTPSSRCSSYALPPCPSVEILFHGSPHPSRAPQQERPARTKGRCELDCKKRRR